MTEGSPLLLGDAMHPRDRAVTVASVPAGHPYVRRMSAAPGVTLLPDPPVADAAPGIWWPPVVLDPAWIDAHRASADLLHIHFGTESFRPGHLTACIDAAHRAGWPVVYTAHDLVHPQTHDQDAYGAQLDEIIPAADAIITLTPGAADDIRRRWGRDAVVIPHPSLLEPEMAAPAVLPSEDVRVGVYLKDLRPAVDGPGSVRTLLEAVDGLRRAGVPAVAEVRMHHRVRDDAAREEVRRLCDEADHAVLIEHERLSDRGLAISLSRLDACLLPYRHGTHSGWLELCWDLGVPVAAPDIGRFREQHDDGSVASWHPGDVTSLTQALSDVLAAPLSTRSGSSPRAELVAARHALRAGTDAAAAAQQASLYRSLVKGRAS